jgi:hypothetical protein
MADINRMLTGSEIITRVMNVLGLPVSASPASASDSTTKQMWALLTECGQEIMDEYDWEVINKVYTISVQDPVLIYDLPSDFQQFLDSTGWNNTSRIPLIGPVSNQIWRTLIARNLGGTTYALQYVIRENKVEFYWAPSTAQTVTIAYQGRGWCQDASNPTIYRDHVQNNDDIVMFDPRMVITKLLLEWRKRKGFDTVDEQEAYNKALRVAKYNDAPKVDLRTAGTAKYPYLGYVNMPDTLYGG